MEAPAALSIGNSSCETNSNSSGNRVCFGSVHIRTYDVTLGTRRTGGQEKGVIPLTISWDYEEFGSWPVDTFEKQRIPERRPSGEESIRIDADTGYRVLREAGFSKRQIRREMFGDADVDKTSATRKIWSKMVTSKSIITKNIGQHRERQWIRRAREDRAQF
jgi:hypothetical protein